MTNMATTLTPCVDMEVISQLFVRYKGFYGGLWTCRASSDQEWQWVMEDWLEALSGFSLEVLRAAFKKSITEFVTAPPTLPQLVQLCIKESGVPSVQEVIRLMIARDFNHPLVKMVYDKIGSWTLSNGKEEEIQRKAKEHYTEALSQFHVDPEREWLKLVDYNVKTKELPPPEKILTAKERKGFKERMAEYQKMAEEVKEQLKDNRQKEFDYSRLKAGSRDFDTLLFREYKAYLLGIPENMVLTLSVKDSYARMRFLAQRDQAEYLKKVGYLPPNQRPHGESLNSSDRNGRPTKIYKTWMND